MTSDELAGKIKEFFEGEVLFDSATLDTYSHDTSIFEVRPQVVVFPKNVGDIEKLVVWVG